MKKMQWIVSFLLLGLALGVVGMATGSLDFIMGRYGNEIAPVSAEATPSIIVIDPGHGGEDGGCSSENGVVEKDLNLTISKNVRDILCASGYPTVLTREEDKLLYDMYGDLQDYTGHKKVYDLRNRLRFSEESGAKCLVSIHMNKFTDSKYRGLQVYYSSGVGESVGLADKIQSYTKTYLQPDNHRLTKKAGTNIYLLNRSQIPAVLVECGFLSNNEETALLTDGAYRKKLSLCIAAAITDSLEIGEEK